MPVWVFLVLFPVLLGGPVVVRIESQTAEQCKAVRKLMVSQLEAHRSNAVVRECLLGVATVVPE
jgi:hypothetical protein